MEETAFTQVIVCVKISYGSEQLPKVRNDSTLN